MDKTTDKTTFITAYCWDYGCTKKQAEQVYKEMLAVGNIDYIRTTIEGYLHQSRLAFYND